MSRIFAENAPRYWAAGLPVIPLEDRGKAVKVNGWSAFCSVMPDEHQQHIWLNQYPTGNIGLALGPCSGLVGIDVDTDEPKVHAMLEKLLPPTPWKRKGQKGFVYIYKYTGERTFRIRDVNNDTILECLSLGAQIVIPPSIHPKTQLPYQANTDLIDVLKSVPPLPPKVEVLIRGALIDLGYELATQGFTKISSYVPSGSRDSAMTAHAGILSRAVVNGERTLSEALAEITEWVESYTERVAGDTLDPAKAREKVIGFFVRDCTGPKRRPVKPGWEIGLEQKVYAEIKLQLGEDGEAWDFDRFNKEVMKLAEENPDAGSAGWMAGLQVIVNKMVNCSAMTPMEENMICRFLVNTSGKLLTIATLRRQIDDQRRGELEGVNHTEIAEALVGELKRYGEVRYHNTHWWQWNGAYWKELDETDILRKVAETFGAYPAAKRHSDHRGILNIAASMVNGDICQKPVEGINFANGFLTTDLQLVPHHPDYGKTYVLPYRHMPDQAGQMPRFWQFLNDCWGGEEDFDDRVAALREAIAATLFGVATKFQKAVCLFGVAGAGKTTLMDIMLGMMPGESWCTVKPQDWEDTFKPAEMYGKLMNFAGELSEDRLIPGDMFKLIVEGSEIQSQHKYKPLFRFSPRCAHWFATNHLPKSRDTSMGFTRRWLFLVFNRPVPKELKVVDLSMEILSEEREAIAAWAVGALGDLMRRQDYTLPKSHLEKVSDVATSNNSVRFFMSGGGKVRISPTSSGTAHRTSETTLYDAYWAFCNSTAYVKAVSLRNFRHRMQELQGEFGFKLLLVTNQYGAEEAYYECLTLAGNGVK